MRSFALALMLSMIPSWAAHAQVPYGITDPEEQEQALQDLFVEVVWPDIRENLRYRAIHMLVSGLDDYAAIFTGHYSADDFSDNIAAKQPKFWNEPPYVMQARFPETGTYHFDSDDLGIKFALNVTVGHTGATVSYADWETTGVYASLAETVDLAGLAIQELDPMEEYRWQDETILWIHEDESGSPLHLWWGDADASPDEVVDIAIVADGYEDLTEFYSFADRFSDLCAVPSAGLDTRPLSNFCHLLRFWVVPIETMDAGAKSPDRITSYPHPSVASLGNLARFAQLDVLMREHAIDFTVVVSDVDGILEALNAERDEDEQLGGPFRAQAIGDYVFLPIVSTDGLDHRFATSLHELGHTSLGELGDEYGSSGNYKGPNPTKYPNVRTGWSWSQLHPERTEAERDLIASKMPWAEWVGDLDLLRSGDHAVWAHRGGMGFGWGVVHPTPQCRMGGNVQNGFCAICREALTDRIASMVSQEATLEVRYLEPFADVQRRRTVGGSVDFETPAGWEQEVEIELVSVPLPAEWVVAWWVSRPGESSTPAQFGPTITTTISPGTRIDVVVSDITGFSPFNPGPGFAGEPIQLEIGFDETFDLPTPAPRELAQTSWSDPIPVGGSALGGYGTVNGWGSAGVELAAEVLCHPNIAYPCAVQVAIEDLDGAIWAEMADVPSSGVWQRSVYHLEPAWSGKFRWSVRTVWGGGAIASDWVQFPGAGAHFGTKVKWDEDPFPGFPEHVFRTMDSGGPVTFYGVTWSTSGLPTRLQIQHTDMTSAYAEPEGCGDTGVICTEWEESPPEGWSSMRRGFAATLDPPLPTLQQRWRVRAQALSAEGVIYSTNWLEGDPFPGPAEVIAVESPEELEKLQPMITPEIFEFPDLPPSPSP